MGFLDDLYKEHGNDVQEHMATELGIEPGRASQILPKVAPIILGGLKRRMEQRGPAQVEQEVQEAASGIDLGDLAAILRQRSGQRQQAPPQGGGRSGGGIDDLLAQILGRGQQDQANQLMANQLGISPGMAAKIIPMVAPLILGQLMKRGSAPAAGGAPRGAAGPGGGLGGIAQILDRNGDGNVLDDIAGLMASGMGGQKSGGCLSAILGGLLGGGRR
jgi:hypothetical protein